jgi:ABC-type sugar transport system permease subunit
VKLGKSSFNTPLLFILPTLFIIVVFWIAPAVTSVYLSLTDPNNNFIGVDNYIKALTDVYFQRSIAASLLYMCGNVAISVLIALIMSFLMNNVRGEQYVAAAWFLPWMFSTVMAGLMFSWLFNPSFGLINAILVKLEIIDMPILWLSSYPEAMITVIIAGVWGACAFGSLVILSGLKSIPNEIINSAKLEVPHFLSMFKHIYFPWIKGQIILFATLQTIWTLQEYGLPLALTSGGPGGRTAFIFYYVYKEGFLSMKFNLAAAQGFISVLFISLFIVVYTKVVKPMEIYSR